MLKLTGLVILLLFAAIWRGLYVLNRKLDTIMAKIDELNQMVADLQTSLDKEQEQIKAALESLQAEIKRLEEIIATGGGTVTDEQLQAVIDNLKVIQTDLEATIPDETTPESKNKNK